jgi:hypothetical protein
VVEVEQWAELRREHFVGGKSIKELAPATGLSRNTVRRALRSEQPPSYARVPQVSVLEPFKDEIHPALREDPKLPGARVRELSQRARRWRSSASPFSARSTDRGPAPRTARLPRRQR